MDFSSNSQVNALDSAPCPESRQIFTHYHPQYQAEYPTYQDDQHASFIFYGRECLGESAYHPLSVSGSYSQSNLFLDPSEIETLIVLDQANLSTTFDTSGGYVAMSTLGSPENGQFIAQHAVTIPTGNVLTYSELMPNVVVHR